MVSSVLASAPRLRNRVPHLGQGSLTGYYERYAALMADAGQPSLKMHRRAFGTTTVRAAARRAAACPVVPEFLQRPLGLALDAAAD